MARDRKRARQRQQRRVREMAPTPDAEPLAQNLPGSLQHTGEVDEFDAALVRGARPHQGLGDELDHLGDGHGAAAPGAEEIAENPFAEGEPMLEDGGAADARSGSGRGERAAVDRPRRSAPAQRGGGNRVIAFLRASWAELQRVQWPDRRQVAQATAVVLGFVVVAGLYLGVADWVAQKVVDFVL